MAPWTHTYISPQSERRICCASREQAQFTRQYIDKETGAAHQEFQPQTLEEHWNSPYMKNIRSKMLRGEKLDECEVCNEQTLNLSTYKAWFTDYLFRDKIDQVFAETREDGHTDLPPVSFDYRVHNTCNFKCRMCGNQLSSAWEQELRLHNAWDPKGDAWMQPELSKKIGQFQSQTVEKEFEQSVERGVVEEIYWVGGEPLVWDFHWRMMDKMKTNGSAAKVYCRYNTNLSIIQWKGVHLFKDLLPHFKDYIMCCSLDAVGDAGEWIRTGLHWGRWQDNFQSALDAKSLDGQSLKDKVKLDLTLTLPGLLYIEDYFNFSLKHDVDVLSKLVYGFTPDKVVSPLALPKAILHPIIDQLLKRMAPRATDKQRSILELLQNLKTRSTFDESFPQNYKEGFRNGKGFMMNLAKWRSDGTAKQARTIESLFEPYPEVLAWWNQSE